MLYNHHQHQQQQSLWQNIIVIQPNYIEHIGVVYEVVFIMIPSNNNQVKKLDAPIFVLL